MNLYRHPRLWIGSREIERARLPPKLPILQIAQKVAETDVEKWLSAPHVDYPRERHNALLIRARRMQGRILTLLLRLYQTGEERFRSAVLMHVREMARWRYWSWIAWKKGDARADAIFDLSYGENSATLAMAYDLLNSWLSTSDKAFFVELAERRSFKPFLKHTSKVNTAFWYGRPDSNWNAVCAGGAGLLALALYEEAPSAPEVLRRAEWSISRFFKLLEETGGAWPEGIGYWNYGMYYGFMYLLSWERATGRQHPLLGSPSVRRTLHFPLDFCPNGCPCSFGDSNHWRPHPFHFAIAERLKCNDILAELDRRLRMANIGSESGWPEAALLLLFHPRRAFAPAPQRRCVVRLYRGLDWAVLADRLPAPRLYLSVRGGTTKVPHGHRDLMSFHCVVGDETMITNVNEGEYLDTTFGPRRHELFEMSPLSKNTIFINGVGITANSRVHTRIVRLGEDRGIRIVGTEAMGEMRDGPAARFCGRLFMMLGGEGFLIIDRFDLPAFGRVESRMHSFAHVSPLVNGAVLQGKSSTLQVAYGCSVPARLWLAQAAPTTPGEGAHVLRWCTEGLHLSVTMATLLVPGRRKAVVNVEERPRTISIYAEFSGHTKKWTLTSRLLPLRR